MYFSETIKFCSRGGSENFPESPNGFVCELCAFHFHVNASCAVLGLIAVESHAFLKPDAVGSDELAFPSVGFALQLF